MSSPLRLTSPPLPDVTIEILTQVLDSLAILVWCKDCLGHYFYANDTFAHFHHVSKADLMGKSDYDLLAKEVAMQVRFNDLSVLNKDETLITEEFVPVKDGEMRTWFVTKFPLKRGETTIGVGGMAYDITDLKHTEDNLSKKTKMLESLLSAIPDAVFVVEIGETRGMFFSSRIEDLIGFTSDELKAFEGKLAQGIVHAEDMAAVKEHEEELRHCKQDEVKEVTFRVRHKGGGWVRLHARAVPFARDESGSVSSAIGIAQALERIV